LRGKIKIWKRYGPPNFGETPKIDEIDNVPVLVLSKGISTCGNSSKFDRDAFRNEKFVQLLPSSPLKRSLLGIDVIVRGKLMEAQSGHHHTDVLIEVESITKP